MITDAGTAEERARYTGLETRALSERTLERTIGDNAALIADLTDLLQLEFDALPAYTVAIAGLRPPDLRETLTSFRADHERHAHDLSAHIRRLDGVPLALPHLPTGLLKLAVQMAGLPGGDRAVLLAFVSNEWQSQEKYARYAARPYPPELAALVQRHAADEARHYAWACGALEGLGCGADTAVAGPPRPSRGSTAPRRTPSRRSAAPRWKRRFAHSGRRSGNRSGTQPRP